MADIETLQAQLNEAQAAYHQLMTGTAKVRVRYGEREVEYTRAKAGDLAAYIAGLKQQLGLGGGRRAFGVRLA